MKKPARSNDKKAKAALPVPAPALPCVRGGQPASPDLEELDRVKPTQHNETLVEDR